MNRLRIMSFIVIITVALSTFGCGGGSEGTGSRSITGRVLKSDDTPFSGAVVELIQTGDETVTDINGSFVLKTDFSGPDGELSITSDDIAAVVPLPEVDSDTTTLNLDITVEVGTGEISTTSVQSWAKIVGACDIYFENNERIRQANKVPRGTECTAKFFVSGDGKRLERVSGAIEVRACDSDSWRLIAVGETGFGINAGVGQISFSFRDDNDHCEYRIGAPYGYDEFEPIYTYIDTFTLQKRST